MVSEGFTIPGYLAVVKPHLDYPFYQLSLRGYCLALNESHVSGCSTNVLWDSYLESFQAILTL